MRLSSIKDREFTDISNSHYDLAIFASGYESRCRRVSAQLPNSNIARTLVLGFEFVGNDELRQHSDEHFRGKWGIAPHILNSSDEMAIYSLLNNELRNISPHYILIDYSSMSRSWYAAILNWLRFNDFSHDVFVDLVYSSGAYSNDFSPIAVESILPLPGCEGSSGTITKSIAVFGLGFEGMAPLCVLDKLQPDEIFTYLASPAADDTYPRIAREKNKELIDLARETLGLPIASVAITFSKLAEVISPYLGSADITFVPMGPKPHVLAAILLAIRFDQVTCLHVNGTNKEPVDVITTGDVIGTRLHFKPESIS